MATQTDTSTKKLPLLVGVVRLLQDRIGTSVMSTEVNKALKSGGSVNLVFEKTELVITGVTKDDVQQACSFMHSNYLSRILHDTLQVNEADLRMDITSTTSFPTELVDILEQTHQCVVEVRVKGMKTLDEIVQDKLDSGLKKDRSTLLAVHGNLTEYHADVLVNTIIVESKDLADDCPLARAFLSAGGQELNEAYGKQKTPTIFGKDVVVTPSSGSLSCEKVYHVALRRYDDANSLEKFQSLISTCLSMAKVDGMRTIAFPTLGCGKLGYHVKDVAGCFRKAARTVGGLQIHIVALDHGQYEIMKKHTSSTASSIVFHVNALNDSTLATVREELKCRAMKLVLTLPVVHSAISLLSAQAKIDLAALNTNDVDIDIDNPNSTIVIRAPSQNVDTVRAAVLHILDAEKRRLADPAHMKSVLSLADYLKELAVDRDPVTLPSYWTSQADTTNTNPFSSATCVSVDSGSKVFREIQRFIADTWDTSHVGHGNDAVGLTHRSIDVKHVWRIENPLLYTKYRSKRKELCLSASHQLFPSVNGLDGEAEVASKSLGLTTLEEDVIPEVNEYLFLHGTKKDFVSVIRNQGLDSRISASIYFGSGVYCAESSTKADQYADNPQSRVAAGQPLYMYVVRALLGHPYVARKPYNYRRPPCKQPGCPGVDRCVAHSAIYDSIIGTHRPDGTRLLFREFIVYHPDQSYPEYLIEYTRK